MSVISELFVSIGVKGSEKTVETFVNINKGLGSVKEMSLETKAALVAAAYALDRLFVTSAQRSNQLLLAGNYLQMDQKVLQQYIYAAHQAGLSTETMIGTFGKLKNALSNVQYGHLPNWLNLMFGNMHIQATKENINRFVAHPEEFLQLLRKYFEQFNGKIDWAQISQLMDDMLGQEVTSAMFGKENPFDQKVLNKAPIVAEGNLENIDKNRKALTDLEDKLKADFDKMFGSTTGSRITQDIINLANAVESLAKALVTLSDKWDVIKTITGWVQQTADVLTGGDEQKAKDSAEKKYGKNYTPEQLNEERSKVTSKSLQPELEKGKENIKSSSILPDWFKELLLKKPDEKGASIAPNNVSSLAATSIIPSENRPLNVGAPETEKPKQITVNQSLAFNGNDGSDFNDVARAHQQAAERALRFSYATVQNA